METNYYQILGVANNASIEEIRKAFRTLAKLHHPDKGGDKQRFQLINEASQVLTNSELRRNYDSQTLQQGSTFSQQQQSNANKYEYPLDEDSSKVVFALNKLKSYTQISEILLEIRPLMEIVRAKSTESDYLNFSSMITVLLMNVIINDANQMVQNYHAYVKIDEEGLKLSCQKLKEIGNCLVMDTETRNIYSRNKRDLETALHNCSGKKFHSIAQITALSIIVFFFFFLVISFNENRYVCIPLFFMLSVFYKILYYLILWIIGIIDYLYWNIKTLFI
jgi:hypothetical protein